MAALMRYAIKLTLEPWNVSKNDLMRLRELGLSDRDIVDANQVISYFAYANRVTDGLGVELEESWSQDVRQRQSYGLRSHPYLRER
jgi:uncharacterized peroxidase-related enzyme